MTLSMIARPPKAGAARQGHSGSPMVKLLPEKNVRVRLAGCRLPGVMDSCAAPAKASAKIDTRLYREMIHYIAKFRITPDRLGWGAVGPRARLLQVHKVPLPLHPRPGTSDRRPPSALRPPSVQSVYSDGICTLSVCALSSHSRLAPPHTPLDLRLQSEPATSTVLCSAIHFIARTGSHCAVPLVRSRGGTRLQLT